MMEAVYRVWLWVAILFTALTYASPMETADCKSQIVHVIALEQTHVGITITSMPAVPDVVESSVITELSDVVVPRDECGLDYGRCPLECMRGFDDLLCPIPVRKGTQNYLALVQFRHTTSLEGFQVKELVYVAPKSSCVPIQIFVRKSSGPLKYFVPCLDTTSDRPFIYFEYLHLETDITNSTLADNTYYSKQYITINKESLSQLVYGTDATCFPPHNVFMKVGTRVVSYRIFHDVTDFRLAAPPIENCFNTEDFRVFEPVQLRVQCAADDVALYDPCHSESVVERYNTIVNATVFQCSAAAVNVYHFQGHLSIVSYGDVRDDVMEDITLPFNDTTNALCVGGDTPTLFLSRSNGEAYVVDLSTGILHYLAANTCGPYSCLRLNVLEMDSGIIVGVFDYSNNTYVVLNLTCPGILVLSRMHYPNPPIMFTLVLSKNTWPCLHCEADRPDTRPTPGPTTEDPTHPDGTIATDPSIGIDTPTQRGSGLDASDNSHAVIGATAGTVVMVVLALVMVTLVIVFVGIHFYRKQHPGSTTPPAVPDASPTSLPYAHPRTTCGAHQSVDQGRSRYLVTPRPDRTEPTPEQVAGNYHLRIATEEKSNDMRQKMAAM